MSKALLLNRSDVAALLKPDLLKNSMRSAFIGHSLGNYPPTKRVPANIGSGTAMILMPGCAEDIPAYSVKVHAKFPDHPPAIKGVLLLHDLSSGQLLSVMDSSYLTGVRTGFCAALATDILARETAKRVAIIGAGVQGAFQLRYLADFRQLDSAIVFDTSEDNSQRFVRGFASDLPFPLHVASSLEHALDRADIVMTATWATEPFIFRSGVTDGMHITTLGPDQPNKCEVDASVIQDARFICDDRQLALSMGAIAGANLTEEHIYAELGEVLAGKKQGRRDNEQITVYGSVGLAFQDLVVGWQVYQSALREGVGTYIDFLA